jgi:hypothetical protein
MLLPVQVSSPIRRAGQAEVELLALCASTLLSGERATSLRTALALPHDWEAFERWAEYHSMIPAVAHVLAEYGGEFVPREVMDELRRRWMLIAANNLARVQDWRHAMQALETAGIPAISLKGPALALLVYQNVALRQFMDLDLLIRPVDVPKACAALTCNGYRLDSPLANNWDGRLMWSGDRELKFVQDGNGAVLDVHWGVLPPNCPFQMPVDLLFDFARKEHQNGTSFLSFSREHLFVFLCAHGAKHCWRSLQWLCDLAGYVNRFQDLDWESCIRQAITMHCELVVAHSLLLAQQVLGLTLPEAIDSFVREDSKANMAAAKAIRFLMNPADMGAYDALDYYLSFTRNWREKLHCTARQIFVPNAADWERVRLPHYLSFIYYVIRPLRLVLDRLTWAVIGR